MTYLDLAPFSPQGGSIEDQHGEALLSMTLWGEARGEGLEGMQAVANVILNRARKPLDHWWFHKTYVKQPIRDRVKALLLKQWQFSIFNLEDPNRKKILVPWKYDSRKIWTSAKMVAAGALDGLLEDNTHGADHYHSYPRNRLDLWPSWAKINGEEPKPPASRVGAFHFYQLEP